MTDAEQALSDALRVAGLAPRLAPLAGGLGLTETEVVALGLDLVAELLDDDPEVLRARVAEAKAARKNG